MSYVPIELDKARNFKYGMKAISLIEKKFKKPMAKVDMDTLTMEETATIMWAGLAHEDKSLTPDRLMDLIDNKGNFKEVLEAMGKAFNEGFGGFDGGNEEEKNM